MESTRGYGVSAQALRRERRLASRGHRLRARTSRHLPAVSSWLPMTFELRSGGVADSIAGGASAAFACSAANAADPLAPKLRVRTRCDHRIVSFCERLGCRLQ